MPEAVSPAASTSEVADLDLKDVADESLGLKGLPARFSELKDEHYPLFISLSSSHPSLVQPLTDFRLLAQFACVLPILVITTGAHYNLDQPLVQD